MFSLPFIVSCVCVRVYVGGTYMCECAHAQRVLCGVRKLKGFLLPPCETWEANAGHPHLATTSESPFYPESPIQHPYFLLQRYLPMTWNLDPLSHANYFFYVCSSSSSVWDSSPSKFSPLFTDFNLTLFQQSTPWPSSKGSPDFPCFSPSSVELALQDFSLCFLSAIISVCLLLLTLPDFFKLGFGCWLLFYIQKIIKTIHDWVWLHRNKWVLGIQSIFSPF